MNIPNKINLYVGKTITDLNEKILAEIESKFEENGLKNFEFHTSRQYGNFPAFIASLDCTKLVYTPCQIYYDILANKREKGRVILTLE